jgi:hypothetical protein
MSGSAPEPVAGILLLPRALLSTRFPWSAPFDNRRTQCNADVGGPPPQIGQRRHVPRDAQFSVAHETADRDDPPPFGEQRFARATRQTAATIGAGAHSLNTGLLGRPWRPSVARTASSLEWLIEGYATTLFRRAAASFENGRTRQGRASRGVPGSGMCGARHTAGKVYRHIPYPARPEGCAVLSGARDRRSRRPTGVGRTAHRPDVPSQTISGATRDRP